MAAPVVFAPKVLGPSDQIDAPGEEPSGLAWDGTNLWVIDAAKRQVQRASPVTKKWTVWPVLGLNLLGPAAFDAKNSVLWVIDRPGAQIARPGGRTHTHPQTQICRIPIPSGGHVIDLKPNLCIPVTSRADIGPVTGLAWDGTTLWLSAGEGLCACVYRIDPQDGKVLLSFFPRCQPVGIAIDPEGERLWIAADNGPNRSALLLQRSLTGQKDHEGRPVSVLRSQQFLALQAEVRPNAIAATSSEVWVLDSAKKRLLRYL